MYEEEWMKYIINGRFYSQKITGVQRYAREIVKELDKICHGMQIEIAIPQDAEDVPSFSNIRATKIGEKGNVLWEQTTFSKYVRKSKAASINLCNSAPLTGKKIVVIHDVKVTAHPEFFNWKFRAWYQFLFRNITKKALKIITVSEFSKQEIIRYFHCNPDKVHVVYSAWQHYDHISVDESVLKKFSLRENDYIFALGSLDPNKNLPWILKAAENDPSEKFIVGGGINFSVFAKQKIQLPQNVHLIGYLSDVEAKSLMRYCKAFVFPSFYEGFGVPPMEAMVAGAPVIIVSDIPVMHEIFGDSVYYIDPNATSFNFPAEDNYGKNETILNTKILDKYSWEKSAGRLLSLLR